MEIMNFKAYAITNEIDLNKIAVECNIPKKYTWEEPLILQGNQLNFILKTKVSENQKIMVFSFGSVVFINIPDDYIPIFLQYIKTFEPNIDIYSFDRYSDDYELRFSDNKETELNDKYTVVPQYDFFYPELVSTVIAKSVAMERTEEQLEKILDKLEGMIDKLEKGHLKISDKKLARTIAKVIRHEYNTIAYIMILDKPDITWANSDAGEFYDKMSDFFELNDRYEILRKKTEILKNIIDGFSAISHSMRGLFVEWVIVILIVLEVILMIIDLIG